MKISRYRHNKQKFKKIKEQNLYASVLKSLSFNLAWSLYIPSQVIEPDSVINQFLLLL